MNQHLSQLLSRLHEQFKQHQFFYGSLVAKDGEVSHFIVTDKDVLDTDAMKDFIHVNKSGLIRDGFYEDVNFIHNNRAKLLRNKAKFLDLELVLARID
jgi:hypothetical protein